MYSQNIKTIFTIFPNLSHLTRERGKKKEAIPSFSFIFSHVYKLFFYL